MNSVTSTGANSVEKARWNALRALETYDDATARSSVGCYGKQQYHVNSRVPNSNGGRLKSVGLCGSVAGRWKYHSSAQALLYRSNSSLDLEYDTSDTYDSCPGNGVASNGTPQNYRIQHHSNVTRPHAASHPNQYLRREYGSHGSLDVAGGPSGESFFDMLKDYRPVVDPDQRSPGPARIAEYLRGRIETTPLTDNAANSLSLGIAGQGHKNQPSSLPVNGDSCHGAHVNSHDTHDIHDSGASSVPAALPNSPKLKLRFHRFLRDSHKDKDRHGVIVNSKSDSSTTMTATDVVPSTPANQVAVQRRAFAHYDCQSLSANLTYAARLHSMLASSRRKNTTTGASAAALAHRNSVGNAATSSNGSRKLGGSAEQLLVEDESLTSGTTENVEIGDGRSNGMLMSCPFFRNEIGGEEERCVGLTRATANRQQNSQPYVTTTAPQSFVHRPSIACGLSVLDFAPSESHWKGKDPASTPTSCPHLATHKPSYGLDYVDRGAYFYRQFFHGQDHQNWFGIDENLGPVAISIKREKVPVADAQSNWNNEKDVPPAQFQYRLIVRTSELFTLRGTVLEECVPNLKPPSNSSCMKVLHAKEVIEFVTPEVQLSCLRLGVSTSHCEEQLMKLDEQGVSNHYKVGVLYCKAGQSTEEEMYNNEEGSPALDEFLELIGRRVRLKGFDGYRAGLDNRSDSTGTHSVYAQYKNCEVMFHVSTLLPFTPNNRQQLLRKRHIGNDIVTIVFQEPGALPFTPKSIRSQFQHVFVVVQVLQPGSENTQYSVAVSRSKEVPPFGPPVLEGSTFPKSKMFADFLLAKVINAENAAHRSEKFATMATRTRQEYLKDLAANYITATTIETSPKFPILSFSSGKKKDKGNAIQKLVLDSTVRGALCWQVSIDDCGRSSRVECFLGISYDTLVLVEEATGEIVFAAPTSSILGWSTSQSNGLRLYYHQGECIILHTRETEREDEDVVREVCQRLTAVTTGCDARELTLRRNPVGQLGFHIQQDGIVTEVETSGCAWQAGLRQGSRLVEICKVAASTLTQGQMVDLLKTSVTVTVTIIPPLMDGSPRRGCSLANCSYTLVGSDNGDYENLNGPDERALCSIVRAHLKVATHQQPVPGGHQRRYERGTSPPRSSNSSGYGTGSSSKSFGSIAEMGTQASSDWFDLRTSPTQPPQSSSPPPPLPSRIGSAFQNVSGKWKSAAYSLPHISANDCVTNEPLSLREQDLSQADQHGFVQHHRLTAIKSASFPVERVTTVKQQQTPMKSSATLVQLPADGHSTDSSISDRMQSEEDLSSGSRGHSPNTGVATTTPSLNRSVRRGAAAPSSSNSSRNGSPRTVCGEVRLRPTAGAARCSSNRSSANLTGSSTLQEELMRLINPDYLVDSEPSPPVENSKSVEETASVSSATANALPAGDVIFTTARPATVISNASTASSPAPSESKLSKEERLSPRATTHTQPIKSKPAATSTESPVSTSTPLPLPENGQEIDWPSLVDTATRAMQQAVAAASAVTETEERTSPWSDDIAGKNSSAFLNDEASGRRFRELQSRVKYLESQLQREQVSKAAMQSEMKRLREDNHRLQEESQTAAQQLRRFTEWFFHTIDKQQ